MIVGVHLLCCAMSEKNRETDEKAFISCQTFTMRPGRRSCLSGGFPDAEGALAHAIQQITDSRDSSDQQRAMKPIPQLTERGSISRPRPCPFPEETGKWEAFPKHFEKLLPDTPRGRILGMLS